jgi:aspartyl-tRNA(Asn)/glutamyl-tRNA(Gln) amidotransferase subunit B
MAKEGLSKILETGADPSKIFVTRAISSAEDLKPLIRQVLEENPGPVKQYLGGKNATLGFLVGQVMKKSGGQAVPQVVQEILRQELESVSRSTSS